MKIRLFSILTVYIFLFVCGSVFGQNENTIVLGGGSSWRMAEVRNGITEINAVRPDPVLALSSATGASAAGYTAATGVWGNFTALSESALDASISFDENNARFYNDSLNRYRLTVSQDVEAADRRYARAGTGAALFNGLSPVYVSPQGRDAMFASGNRIRDFTVEFWLYPLNMENGEQIFSWNSITGANTSQRIYAFASKNRFTWSFVNFFASTNGASYINLEFSGNTPIVPKTWSHHLIRFDASTGMLEYLVNGVCEAVVYATPSGREGSFAGANGEVFTPVTGAGGVFTLGERFVGLIDEFKTHNVCIGRSTIQKYASPGGRVETRAIDLGENNSGVLRVHAFGGRISVRGSSARGVINEFRENGRFRFSDDSEIGFFIRASENPYNLHSCPWLPFTPGSDIADVRGRYVQIAADFYPSSDGETSPYLSELRIVYLPGEPPLPPRNVTAIAVDGGVLLRWRNSPNANTAGYLIYYGSVRGEFFGTDALLGASPVNAGNRNSILIEGLKNGTLYYFRIASYDEHDIGEFSAEVTARPLAGLSLTELSAPGNVN